MLWKYWCLCVSAILVIWLNIMNHTHKSTVETFKKRVTCLLDERIWYPLVLEDSYVVNVGNKGVLHIWDKLSIPFSDFKSIVTENDGMWMARGIPDLDELRNASRNADPLFPAFARLARAPSLAAPARKAYGGAGGSSVYLLYGQTSQQPLLPALAPYSPPPPPPLTLPFPCLSPLPLIHPPTYPPPPPRS